MSHGYASGERILIFVNLLLFLLIFCIFLLHLAKVWCTVKVDMRYQKLHQKWHCFLISFLKLLLSLFLFFMLMHHQSGRTLQFKHRLKCVINKKIRFKRKRKRIALSVCIEDIWSYSEGATRGFPWRKVFLKISQNS